MKKAEIIKDQRGFALLWEIVLVAVVIGVVAVAAYATFTARSNQKPSDTQQNQQAQTEEAPKPQEPAKPDDARNYFIVKELGIKFVISDDIKDLTYNVSSGGDGSKIARFSTASITSSGGQYCAASGAPLGAISLKADPNSPGGESVKQLGSQYLIYTPPQAPCSENASVMELVNKARASFQPSLKSAELAQ